MAAELSPGFARLAAAARLARRDRRHTLVISVAPIFAARWLIWRLPRFSARHPEIRLRLEAQVALTEPGLSDVDLALRVGPGGWKGVRAEHLWEQRVTPVCAPAVAARLERPEDLAGVPIIRDVNSMYGWECWLAPVGLDEALLGPGPEFSDGSLCLDAAISGAGVFLSWETLHSHALATGQLVAPFGRRHPTGQGYWLVSAAERGLGPAQSHFRRWLKQELAADGIISDPRR
jgi:DNA-binding transcriptional LysR family regulator